MISLLGPQMVPEAEGLLNPGGRGERGAGRVTAHTGASWETILLHKGVGTNSQEELQGSWELLECEIR